MSKYRLEKEHRKFAVVSEYNDSCAGYISPEYEVRDHYGDEIAVVGSMDEAVATLVDHLSATSPQWEGGGAGRFIKVTHDYFDTLVVARNPAGRWTAFRNDYPLENGSGAASFSTASEAQRAADLHAGDGRSNSISVSDGLRWLIPSDNAEDEQRYRIENCLGEIVADAAEEIFGGIPSKAAQPLEVLIRRLCSIREASLFGSYDTVHRLRDRYFFLIENGKPSASSVRLSFAEAAHHYGKLALRERVGPDPSDTDLGQMISAVLARLPFPDDLST
jgi:hypothetical protein